MASDVIRLVPETNFAEPDPQVIERIEEWLEMAKSGRINGVVMIGMAARAPGHYGPPVCIFVGPGVTNCGAATIGAMRCVEQDLIDNMDRDSVYEASGKEPT